MTANDTAPVKRRSATVHLVKNDDDLAESNLDELAAMANRFHAEVEAAGQSMLVAAWRAGQALLSAKALCEHGEWLPWLEANFHGSARTAQVYMQLAREATNPQRAAYLDLSQSIRATLEAVIEHNQPDEEYDDSSSGNSQRNRKWNKQKPQAMPPCETFARRYDPMVEDLLFIADTVSKGDEFALVALERINDLIKASDVLTTLIQDLRRLEEELSSSSPANLKP